MNKAKELWVYVLDRRASFSYTLGSIAFGFYHFFHPNVLTEAKSFEMLNYLLGLIGGRNFGLLFIGFGTLKLYGLFSDRSALKLPMYFALLFLWILLSGCFFITFLLGSDNSLWILTSTIVLLSTTIINSHQAVPKRRGSGG